MTDQMVAQAAETQTAPSPRWLTPGKGIQWLITIAGLIGMLAATELTNEKMKVLADPNYVPNCSLNPILSCGTVMSSPQAAAFGFSNTFLGIIAFSALLAIGVGMLAGARYHRWFWIGMQIGVVLGIVFVFWLQFQSIYSIQKLCLYCMIVWACTIPAFVGVTIFNFKTGVIALPEGGRRFFERLSRYAWAIVLVWYAIIFAAIIIKFPNVLVF